MKFYFLVVSMSWSAAEATRINRIIITIIPCRQVIYLIVHLSCVVLVIEICWFNLLAYSRWQLPTWPPPLSAVAPLRPADRRSDIKQLWQKATFIIHMNVLNVVARWAGGPRDSTWASIEFLFASSGFDLPSFLLYVCDWYMWNISLYNVGGIWSVSIPTFGMQSKVVLVLFSLGYIVKSMETQCLVGCHFLTSGQSSRPCCCCCMLITNKHI